MKLIKTQYKFNTAIFVLLVPDEEDLNGDVISAEEITKAAHEFCMNIDKKVVNINHQDGTDLTKEEACFVESYIAPIEMTVGDIVIPAGSWLVGIKFNQDLFDRLLAGDFSGVSMEGEGIIEKV